MVTTIGFAVALTAGAGALLAVLRVERNDLYVPFALHATVSSGATVAAAMAGRLMSRDARYDARARR